METPTPSPRLTDVTVKTYNRLKKIAFDWQKKQPLYTENGRLAMDLPQMKLEQYRQTIHKFIPQPVILSDDLLNQRVAAIETNAKLHRAMPAGYHIALTVLPFNFNGDEFTAEELRQGFHLQEMIIDQNGVAYSSIAPRGSALFQVMPEEIRGLSFASDGVRENIVEEYKKIFKRAQAIFNTPVESDVH